MIIIIEWMVRCRRWFLGMDFWDTDYNDSETVTTKTSCRGMEGEGGKPYLPSLFEGFWD